MDSEFETNIPAKLARLRPVHSRPSSVTSFTHSPRKRRNFLVVSKSEAHEQDDEPSATLQRARQDDVKFDGLCRIMEELMTETKNALEDNKDLVGEISEVLSRPIDDFDDDDEFDVAHGNIRDEMLDVSTDMILKPANGDLLFDEDDNDTQVNVDSMEDLIMLPDDAQEFTSCSQNNQTEQETARQTYVEEISCAAEQIVVQEQNNSSNVGAADSIKAYLLPLYESPRSSTPLSLFTSLIATLMSYNIQFILSLFTLGVTWSKDILINVTYIALSTVDTFRDLCWRIMESYLKTVYYWVYGAIAVVVTPGIELVSMNVETCRAAVNQFSETLMAYVNGITLITKEYWTLSSKTRKRTRGRLYTDTSTTDTTCTETSLCLRALVLHVYNEVKSAFTEGAQVVIHTAQELKGELKHIAYGKDA